MQHPRDETQRLPSRLAATYGAGYLGVTWPSLVLSLWAVYFYAPPPGSGLTPYAPVGLVGLAIAFGRVVDALADPLVGAWSDNLRSRWGRRLPFVILGAPLLGITFALLWLPPVDAKATVNGIYLALMAAAMLFFYTVTVAPYIALLPDLAQDEKSRVRLVSWQAVFAIAGVLLGVVGTGALIDAFGFGVMGVVVGGAAASSFLLAGLGIRGQPVNTRPANLPFFQALRLTFANGPFVILLTAQTGLYLAAGLILPAIPYFVTVILGLSEGDVGRLLAAVLPIALLGIPLANVVAGRFGLKNAMLGVMGVLAAVLLLLSGLGEYPWVTPQVQATILFALAGIPIAMLFILLPVLTAEVIDYDTARTDAHRAAVYYGMTGLFQKGSLALAALAVSVLLGTFGFTPQQPLGIQLTAPVAALFLLSGMVAFRSYPLGGPRQLF